MESLIKDGRLHASREVLDELEPRDDDCFKWAKAQPELVVDSDEGIQWIVGELMDQYFNPEKPHKGIGGADPFVIAIGAFQKPAPWVIVTGEKPGSAENPKIPWVCRTLLPEPIRTISFLELIRDEGWQLT